MKRGIGCIAESCVPWEQLKELKVFPFEKRRFGDHESSGRKDLFCVLHRAKKEQWIQVTGKQIQARDLKVLSAN